jgi:type III pantothenate kinase
MVAGRVIFVCDVGNTNIVMGAFSGDKLIQHWRISTDREKTEDEFAMIINNLLAYSKLTFDDFDGVAISTVVPSVLFSLEKMSRKYFHVRPLIVGPDTDIGINLKYDRPREIGADLIVNAVAAVHDYSAPIIVIDFGTATTYSYIDEHQNYIGGAIAPGVVVSAEALYEKASKLPRIEITTPPDIVGRNTVHAMQSGVVFGYVGQVEGIVARIKKQARVNPVVVATGGLCMLISNETNVIDHVDKLLTLKGLYLIYKRNRNQ